MEIYAAAAGRVDALDALLNPQKLISKNNAPPLSASRRPSLATQAPPPAEKTSNPAVQARIAAEYASLHFQVCLQLREPRPFLITGLI